MPREVLVESCSRVEAVGLPKGAGIPISNRDAKACCCVDMDEQDYSGAAEIMTFEKVVSASIKT